jgi:hypothetical protein
MNIYDATRRAIKENLWIRKRGRTEDFTLHVAAGSVYRKDDGDEVSLDARDCIGNDWYLVNEDADEVA